MLKSNYRYEKKFIIPTDFLNLLLTNIELYPANFRKIYHERKINNIYFDTYNLDSFFSNVEGELDREKIRIRWYNEFFTKNAKANIEIKIKKNQLGTKKIYSLNNFSYHKNSSAANLKEIILSSNISELLKEKFLAMEPTLINSYKRKYFRSFDESFRLTIDSDIIYSKIGSLYPNSLLISDINYHVLELKYNENKDSEASNIINYLKFRVSKNSKYCSGIETLYI